MLLSSQAARNLLSNRSNVTMDVEEDSPDPIVHDCELFNRHLQRDAAPSYPEARIDGQNRCFTSIDYLPNETLGAIFDEGRRVITAREGSWLISVSRVSRRWRDVALHTPFLWTNIYYGPRLRSLGYTCACLERSRNCPLDITLQFVDSDRPQPMTSDAVNLKRVIRYISLIVQHANRWRTLDVHFRRLITLQIALLDRLPSKAAILKHVRFELDHEEGVHERPSREIFGQGAPILASVELRGISFASCKLPLAQLTSLTLTRTDRPLSPSEFRRVLISSLSLRELSLLGDIVSTGREDWVSIQIPSLVSLTLSPGSDTNFTHLCAALIMPGLASLILQHFPGESIRIFIESLRPYTEKYPRLRLLELRIVGDLDMSTTVQIADLFKECPMITQLSLISLQSSVFVPLLERLHPQVARSRALTIASHIGDLGSLDTIFGVSVDTSRIMLDVVAAENDSLVHATTMLFPRLHTIAIAPINRDNIAAICDLISTRREIGRAISCVKASSFENVPPDRFQWLREHVSMLENL
jgi:hypothetical protein